MPTQPNNSHLPFGDQRTAPWYGRDIISVKQFSREDLEYIFAVAHEMHDMVDHVGILTCSKARSLPTFSTNPPPAPRRPSLPPWNAWAARSFRSTR